MAYCKASKWSHFRKAKIDVTIWVLCDYLGTWRISDRSYDSSIRIFVIKKIIGLHRDNPQALLISHSASVGVN